MSLSRAQAAIAAAMVLAAGAILYAKGQPLICSCGYVRLWDFDVATAANSQHLIDWYTPSHLLHGFVFYFLLWLLSRYVPLSFGTRLIIAIAIEATWEMIENSQFAIDRYREATVSLDYLGDSVLNSMSDLLFMIAGFFLAAWLPVWVTILIAVALEVYIGAMIRDNLTLNVIMFVWPFESILQWQKGG